MLLSGIIMNGMNQKAISLRLPAALHEAVKRMAKARKISMNRLIEESIAATAREERSKMLKKEFELIAREEQDVEYAFAAQSEVVLGSD